MILTKFDTIDDKVRRAAHSPSSRTLSSSPSTILGALLVALQADALLPPLQVGAALSMTYVTGQPIYFVGTGQTYSDLRMLRVGHIVQALMQD